MTTQITPPEPMTVPAQTKHAELDERLWSAWIEKNEKRDKVKLVRRVRVIAILVLLTLGALVVKMAS